jgi:hypothetical protein
MGAGLVTTKLMFEVFFLFVPHILRVKYLRTKTYHIPSTSILMDADKEKVRH